MIKITKDQINKLRPSATLAINEKSSKLIKSGKKVYKFGFGQSPFPVPDSVISALKNNANKNTYLPMQGLEELRSTIASYLNKNNNNNFKSDDILIGPGTKELMFLLHILFDGEVLLPSPSWVSYEPQAILGRNKVHWVNTKRENNWFPSAKDIEKFLSFLMKILEKRKFTSISSKRDNLEISLRNFLKTSKIDQKQIKTVYGVLKFITK